MNIATIFSAADITLKMSLKFLSFLISLCDSTVLFVAQTIYDFSIKKLQNKN